MAYFTFTDASDETFVIRLDDPDLIAHARALLAGTVTDEARIGGIVTKAPADYGIGWSYHLAPDSIFFFDMSTEVGDSTMRYIEDHLDEIGGHLLPGSVWTGWSSQLVDELEVQEGQDRADILWGSSGADLLLGRGGRDLLGGGAGDDHLAAGRGQDVCIGGAGRDKLGGGAGDDLLYGGAGRDLLAGGRGDDRLGGGDGNDTFLIEATSRAGREVILDFAGGQGAGDVMRLDASWLEDLSDLTGDGKVTRGDLAAAFTVRGENLVLRHDADSLIILKGAAGLTLHADDFSIG